MELTALTEPERDRMIADRANGAPPVHFVRAVLSGAPPAILPLLSEPVALGHYLDLLELSRLRPTPRPTTLPELFDSLFRALIESRRPVPLPVVDELSAICVELSSRTGPFVVQDVSEAAQRAHASEPALALEELRAGLDPAWWTPAVSSSLRASDRGRM
jgi:hypothetical protein